MLIHTNFSEITSSKPKIVSIGVFDGVHKGHLSLINELYNVANSVDGETYIITFEPHPRIVLGHHDFKLLTINDEKINLLAKTNINHLVVLPFSKEISDLSAKDFVEKILVEKLNIHTLVLGYDNQFGKNRDGSYEALKEWKKSLHFNLIHLNEVRLDDKKISSTQIRTHLLEGNIKLANAKLGYPYTIKGKVIQGNQIGRTIGFPTANLEINSYKLLPKNGSYIVQVHTENKTYKGMLNIGNRPTFNNEKTSVEVYLLDFEGNLYEKTLLINFFEYIREEQKFSSIEALKSQLKSDCNFTQKYFKIL